MNGKPSVPRDVCISLVIMLLAFLVSLLLHTLFAASSSITAIFVLAVFLISLWTQGYVYGITATFVSMFAVNFAFTFPYFAFNFTIPENLLSAVIMIAVALFTCTLTSRLKRQELLRAESEKERMRANLLRAVSHDFRTPLTTIYGASSALLENRQSFTEEQTHEMLEGIREDSDWLIHMVENLLSITKLDSGKVEITKTPVVLDELMDSVLVKFRKRHPGVNFELQLPNEFVLIPMDAILIEQVLSNLLENAVEHAKGMTQLSLKVFLISHRAIFEITDNGCGVDESHIMDIFSGKRGVGEAPPDGRKNFSGIGLSVCATIVRAHGGDIMVENRKNGGAVFRFSLELDTERLEDE